MVKKANLLMNTIQAITQILKAEGVNFVACFPSNPLIEELAKADIRPVMFRQERGALMAADGFSRISNRKSFGIALTQSGPGAENSMGGIAQAFSDNVPILYLPAGPRLSEYAVRPNFSAVKTFETVTTHSEVITNADQTVNVMRRAFHHLRNGRPGPVIVEVPADVGSQQLSYKNINYIPPERYAQCPDSTDIKQAIDLLSNAERPVIWAGMGVLLAGASQVLKSFAEATGIPVFCTMGGKSAFDERHPQSLGSGSGATTLPGYRWIQESDVLLALGSSLTRTPYGQTIPDNKDIIHNTESLEDINKDYSVKIGLPGDAKLTLESLLDEFQSRSVQPIDVTKEISHLKYEWMNQWKPLLTSNEVPLNTYRVIYEIIQNLNLENSIITHDAGAPRDCIVPFYPATIPHSYIGWGKTTHLGFSIPLMIGAKLAQPSKFCLNLMGDAAFGMSGLDLETAVRCQIPITTVVLNNSGMATYPIGTSLHMPVAYQRFGATKMKGDYAQMAEGMGATGLVVKQPYEMADALQEAQKLNFNGKTVLIDVHSNMETQRSRL